MPNRSRSAPRMVGRDRSIVDHDFALVAWDLGRDPGVVASLVATVLE